jgi:hypothetical protein
MSSFGPSFYRAGMAETSRSRSSEAGRFFADLRRHNEHSARVARLLAEKRKRYIEHVIRLQRKHRTHQAR